MKAILIALCTLIANAQVSPVRVIDGNWKTTALRADRGSVFITNERGSVKVTNGVRQILSVDPAWSGDVTRDDPSFKGQNLLNAFSRNAHLKLRPKDSIAAIWFRSGAPWQVNFGAQNTAVLAQVRKPVVLGNPQLKKGAIEAPAGFVSRPQVLAVALDANDGMTVLALYAAWLPGNVMVVGKFTKQATNYKRVGEFLIHVPREFHLMPHMAASGSTVWIGNDTQFVAEYRLK